MTIPCMGRAVAESPFMEVAKDLQKTNVTMRNVHKYKEHEKSTNLLSNISECIYMYK